ncbi:response regulator [Caballeronia sp. LZ032]|uniref:response regulator n=1 Tax=Caballeronia sp. LZ032 TaxID=3038565 RepID=UPI002865B1DA|nr:response regulator [Caballeronia sp. LZ032]MDR5884229.1 response regulator [Caballeronia sp. LZ032]
MQRSQPRFHLWTDRIFRTVAPPVSVLIVDDDHAVADALAHALEAAGMRVTVAVGGAAAMHATQQWTPYLVILDIQMSDADGFTVARALRTLYRLASVPFIAHTSLAEREVIDRGKAALIDAYCRKGKSVNSLLCLIGQLAPISAAEPTVESRGARET